MIIVLMGVTGSGKSTVGGILAESLGWQFLDADEFHSAANIQKMKTGIPLDDQDRRQWLQDLRIAMDDIRQQHKGAVLACSALKESYRAYLFNNNDVNLVYLKGDYDFIRQRLQQRQNHYMNPELLASQFQTLEEPADCLTVDVATEPQEIVKIIRGHLKI